MYDWCDLAKFTIFCIDSETKLYNPKTSFLIILDPLKSIIEDFGNLTFIKGKSKTEFNITHKAVEHPKHALWLSLSKLLRFRNFWLLTLKFSTIILYVIFLISNKLFDSKFFWNYIQIWELRFRTTYHRTCRTAMICLFSMKPLLQLLLITVARVKFQILTTQVLQINYINTL